VRNFVFYMCVLLNDALSVSRLYDVGLQDYKWVMKGIFKEVVMTKRMSYP
jgi:hypothetical protein